MNQVNKNDHFFDFSDLDGMSMLDEVEKYEIEFKHVYLKSMAFLETMIDEGAYEKIKNEMILSAGDYEGFAYSSIEEVENRGWAGYHPVPLLFSRLCWYGEKGVFHYNDIADISEIVNSKALQGEIELAKDFHSVIPIEWLELDDENLLGKGEFGKTIYAAEGRYFLDSGKSLNTSHIIALSGMSLRSVRNSISKNDESGLRVDDNGNISNAEARRWLSERKNFTPTRSFQNSDISWPMGLENLDEVEYVFVPVSDDGTAFLPSLRRPNGYQVGKKGEEKYYDDFYEALGALQSMPTPRFRRPNEQGNWGIKVGSSWMRVAKSEIEKDLV